MTSLIWIILSISAAGLLALTVWLYWRFVWFWRNPLRRPPAGDAILSPADGTVVYVREVEEDEPVIAIKRGRSIRISEIARETIPGRKIHIGIFMSPFDVHYNRAPITGRLEYARQYPASGRNRFMAMMFWRTLLRRPPLHAGGDHIVQNNRTVSRIVGERDGAMLSVWLIQIGAASVAGIDVYPDLGATMQRGEIIGMIRIGSQVDLVVSRDQAMRVLVCEGDTVRAGETPLVDRID